jgi:hypothetical protein
MEKKILKPCVGRRVRDPETLKVLDEAGEEKALSSYWLRRLRDGDVIEVNSLDKDEDNVDFV